jgi:hypothetical protein
MSDENPQKQHKKSFSEQQKNMVVRYLSPVNVKQRTGLSARFLQNLENVRIRALP